MTPVFRLKLIYDNVQKMEHITLKSDGKPLHAWKWILMISDFGVALTPHWLRHYDRRY